MQQVRLFYDAQCPLCSPETGMLRRRLQRPLALVDIHGLEPQQGVPDTATLMRVLHYQSADGSWRLGLGDAGCLAPYPLRRSAWLAVCETAR